MKVVRIIKLSALLSVLLAAPITAQAAGITEWFDNIKDLLQGIGEVGVYVAYLIGLLSLVAMLFFLWKLKENQRDPGAMKGVLITFIVGALGLGIGAVADSATETLTGDSNNTPQSISPSDFGLN